MNLILPAAAIPKFNVTYTKAKSKYKKKMKNRLDFKNIINKLEDIITWIESYNISCANTRLTKYKKLLIKYHKKYNENLGFINEQIPDVAIVLTDIFKLIFVYNSFSGERLNKHFAEKLRFVAKGPYFATEENPKKAASVQPRNHLFELFIAAALNDGGQKPYFTKNNDILIKVNKIDIQIECKRLSSSKNLVKEFKDALSQATRVSDEINKPIGAIFINLTRAISPKYQLASENFKDISAHFIQTLKNICNENLSNFLVPENILFVGLIASWTHIENGLFNFPSQFYVAKTTDKNLESIADQILSSFKTIAMK